MIGWDLAPFELLEVESNRFAGSGEYVVAALAAFRGETEGFRDFARVFKPNLLGVLPDFGDELSVLANLIPHMISRITNRRG